MQRLNRVMAQLALGLLVLTSVIASARAEVAVAPGVPFSASELVAALALRGAVVDEVLVRAVSPTAVELRTQVGRQRVELGSARGPAAARLVALQLTLSSSLPVPFPARVEVAVQRPPRRPQWTVVLAAGGGRGVAPHDFALTAVRADVTAVLGPWRWGAGIGWLHGLARTGEQRTSTSGDLGVLRAVFGVAVGRFEVLAGPALDGYRVAGSSGGAFGASGELRVQLPGGVRWHTTASAQVDAFFHRVVVERDGATLASTPRTALTAMFGIAWGGP